MQDVQGIAETVEEVGSRIQILGRDRTGTRSWLEGEGGGAVAGPHPGSPQRLFLLSGLLWDQLILSESELTIDYPVVKDGPVRRLEPSSPSSSCLGLVSSLSGFSGIVREGSRDNIYLLPHTWDMQVEPEA